MVRVVYIGDYVPGGKLCSPNFKQCVYVGRTVPACHLKAHPLANPFKIKRGASRAERLECLEKYKAWLDALPDLNEQLQRLQEELERSGLPLACWCGNWPEDGDIICHARELAERLNERMAK